MSIFEERAKKAREHVKKKAEMAEKILDLKELGLSNPEISKLLEIPEFMVRCFLIEFMEDEDV